MKKVYLVCTESFNNGSWLSDVVVFKNEKSAMRLANELIETKLESVIAKYDNKVDILDILSEGGWFCWDEEKGAYTQKKRREAEVSFYISVGDGSYLYYDSIDNSDMRIWVSERIVRK